MPLKVIGIFYIPLEKNISSMPLQKDMENITCIFHFLIILQHNSLSTFYKKAQLDAPFPSYVAPYVIIPYKSRNAHHQRVVAWYNDLFGGSAGTPSVLLVKDINPVGTRKYPFKSFIFLLPKVYFSNIFV
jgi:hypothetical protein